MACLLRREAVVAFEPRPAFAWTWKPHPETMPSGIGTRLFSI
jgi:hypothetical protein